MKRLYSLLIASFIAVASLSETYSGSCGNNLTWSLDTQDSTLTINGFGPMDNWTSWGSPWASYNTYIANIIFPLGLTSIGERAFKDCNRLKSIAVPDSVTTIGAYAFSYCTSLSNVIFPNNLKTIGYYSFSGCNSLNSIIIPDSVTIIESGSFSGCSSMRSVSLGNRISSIGGFAFYNCSSIQSMVIPGSVTSIGRDVFSSCTSLKSITINGNFNNNSSVDNSIFRNCPTLDSIVWNANDIKVPFGDQNSRFYDIKTQVRSIIIGNAVDTIYDRMFSDLTNLRYVYIPNTVSLMGKSAFSGCTSLDSIIISEGLTTIDNLAFGNCSALNTIKLPQTINKIGKEAFYGCRNLKSIVIPNNVDTIKRYTFKLCSSMANVKLPDSLKVIESYSFSGCSSLPSITIPIGLTQLYNSAFEGCSSLDSIEWNAKNGESKAVTSSYYGKGPFYEIRSQIVSVIFGDEVESIPNYMCYDMTNLDSITFPNKLTHIGSNAFYKCRKITSITFPPRIKSIFESAFLYCDSIRAVHIGDLGTWCSISFSNKYSNPIYYSKKLFVNNILFMDTLIVPLDVEVLGSNLFPKYNLLKSAIIPSSVTHISPGAFSECDSLTYVKITCGTTKIGANAFYGCKSLPTIVIPNSVTSIGSCAFQNCSKLDSIYLGTAVEEIYSDAFGNCDSLHVMFCMPRIPPRISGYAFRGSDSLNSVYVPTWSFRAYTEIPLDSFAYQGWINIKRKFKYIPMLVKMTSQIDSIQISKLSYSNTGVSISWPIILDADIYSVEIENDSGIIISESFTNTGVQYFPTLEPYNDSTIISISDANTSGSSGGWVYDTYVLSSGIPYTCKVIYRKCDMAVINILTTSFMILNNGDITSLETPLDYSKKKSSKKLIKGKMYILLPDGTRYSATGQRVK